jgi:pyridoxine/pyridoxamine 5'-phosphate oxidase
MRREYAREGLSEADVDADPVVQFGRWFEQA